MSLQKIGENVSRIDRYRSLFAASTQMQKTLGLVFGDILEFAVGSALFLKRPTFRMPDQSWNEDIFQLTYCA